MARRVYGFCPQDDEIRPRLGTVQGGAFQEVKSPSSSDQLILFVPGVDVAVHRRPLPTKGDADSRQAAPFAIEDDVANAVSDLHVALGPRPEDLSQPREIHSVSSDRMAEMIGHLRNLGLANATLVAEQSLLEEGEVVMLDDRIVAHLDGRQIAVDLHLPEDLKAAILGDHVNQMHRPSDPLAAMALFADQRDTLLNLRQGRFRARTQADLTSFYPWRLAGGLAAAVALLWTGSGLMEIRSAKSAADDLRRQTRDIYASAFPGDANTADPVRAVSRALDARQDGAGLDFLETSAVLYAALVDVPSASLRSIRFDTARGGYVASIAYSAYGDDAALKAALGARGIAADLGDSRRGDDAVFGDVTLRRGGA
ncbi:MAG: type II secretion system protein GspL [Pseudomonadota bacterium]